VDPPVLPEERMTPAPAADPELHVRRQVTVSRSPVTMGSAQFNTHKIQLPMAYAPLGNNLLGELAHLLHGASQHHRLDTLVMIQMRMHGGNRQIVVRMLDACETLSELAFVVIVNIGQIGDARPFRVPLLAVVLQMSTQDIAHRLAARGVASTPDQLIEGGRKILIERYRKAIHSISG
jgi:hypothetical protein